MTVLTIMYVFELLEFPADADATTENEEEDTTDSEDSGQDSSNDSDSSSNENSNKSTGQSNGPRSDSEEGNSDKVMTIFIGTIGAALLVSILLLIVAIATVFIYSRRKRLAPKTESISSLEEKQADLKEDMYVKQ